MHNVMHEAAREDHRDIVLAIAYSYDYRLIAGWSVHRARALGYANDETVVG